MVTGERTHLRMRWLVVLSLLGVAACAGLWGKLGPKRDQIKVPHDRHITAKVECGTCHETIFDSTSLTTVDLPKERVCLKCHREEKEKSNCGFCHTRPDAPLTFEARPRQLKMNHAEHIERVKEDCRTCHQALPNPLWTEALAPKMEGCLSCHVHQQDWDKGQCSRCHTDLGRFPLKPIAAFSHRSDFLHSHPLDARSDPKACATCHEQSFCADCHSKVVPRRIELIIPERTDWSFIHADDFLSRHSVEASADEAQCQRCHGVSFCQSCHLQNGLVPGAPNGVNPHPPGFGNGAAHGPAARQDIVSCAACHDQGAASICVSCHKVGGPGGDPHPPSWSLRHSKKEIPSNAMCQTCHL